ncbi:glyoxalase [Congregibacter brevis]|uniref:Glyoxalase n=1 Tax=Congregibacter brevis TaxID=3081201 RepID=A0ABZ0IFN0_9GAMM|nr:glyoxalase [Congregibacter sp. IMCC45268]
MTSPILALDHVTISVADIDKETANYSLLLDAPPVRHGKEDGSMRSVFQTRNVAVHLVASEQPQGLEAMCFEVDSLERLHRRLERVAIPTTDTLVSTAQNSEEPQALLVSAQDATRGIQLSFREKMKTGQGNGDDLGGGLDHIVIASQNSQGTAFLLGSQLALDMRMDMSRREWKARLMFFRCGDLIVEVFERLEDQESSPPAEQARGDESEQDSFYGLTWRVDDADASHKRLTEAGFNVSEVRKGRKPGSRVLTVRDKTAEVATLLIELPKS